jgi:hypothetical protein
VLTLIVILLLTWAVLMAFLVAFTVWFQGYIYTEPTTGILWRGPAAGTAVVAALVLWVLLDYRWPGGFRPLHDFSSTESSKPFPELRVPRPGGGEDVYRLVPGGSPEYRTGGTRRGQRLPSRPQKVIATRDDEKLVFEPDRDAKGNFRTGRDGVLEYRARDEQGRELVMREDDMGRITRFRAGTFLGNLLVNFLFLAAWFLALWLILRFQWTHALGLALVFWAALLLLLLPPVLGRAEAVAAQRAVSRAGGPPLPHTADYPEARMCMQPLSGFWRWARPSPPPPVRPRGHRPAGRVSTGPALSRWRRKSSRLSSSSSMNVDLLAWSASSM